MNNELREPALLPPILRPEVFNNPGAVEWLRGSESPLRLRAWVLVCGCGIAMVSLVIVLLCVPHSQVHSYSGWVVDGQLDCVTHLGPCSIHVRCLPGAVSHHPDLYIGAAVHVIDAQDHEVSSRILAKSNENAVTLSWSLDAAIPSQGITIQTIETRSLIGWTLPRNPFAGAVP